jgi:hypothetical protein
MARSWQNSLSPLSIKWFLKKREGQGERFAKQPQLLLTLCVACQSPPILVSTPRRPAATPTIVAQSLIGFSATILFSVALKGDWGAGIDSLPAGGLMNVFGQESQNVIGDRRRLIFEGKVAAVDEVDFGAG